MCIIFHYLPFIISYFQQNSTDVGVVSFAQPRFDSMATAGMATLLVSRKGNVDNAAFVMFETSDKTAISGTHYRGIPHSLFISTIFNL